MKNKVSTHYIGRGGKSAPCLHEIRMIVHYVTRYPHDVTQTTLTFSGKKRRRVENKTNLGEESTASPGEPMKKTSLFLIIL